MPSLHGLRRHIEDAHGSELLDIATNREPVALRDALQGVAWFLDTLDEMRDLALLHKALHAYQSGAGYHTTPTEHG